MGVDIVVVGCSWGGFDAFTAILQRLPRDLATPIVYLQHRGPSSSDNALVRGLERSSPLPVREVDDKDPLEPGVHVAPADYHVLVERGRLALSTDGRVQYSRPSIDVLFTSAADVYGPGVLALLLTGANADGAEGMAHVRARGGFAIAQDPSTAERAEMPRAAIARGAVDLVAPLDGLADTVLARCGRELAVGGW